MLQAAFKPYHIPLFLAKYAWLTARRMTVLVNFEVTLRCNARCGFCDYWKTDASAKAQELRSFADAARFFNPMLITFTGGEPLLRRDLEDLVSAVVAATRLRYVIVLTHGGMLSVDRARSLRSAGVNQFNVSLDYLDERHDRARGIPGLSARILRTVADMRAAGMDGIRFNTVIKRDNLASISASTPTRRTATARISWPTRPTAAWTSSCTSCWPSSARIVASSRTRTTTSSRSRATCAGR
jgi:molybdenum cofactor biosynthesis enzyme MoaA